MRNENTEEEFLSIPPTNIIDAEGQRKIAEAEANEEAHRAARFQEIRFKDKDVKILRIDSTKTEFREETIEMEGQPPKKIWRYNFTASEYLSDIGKWTRFKTMKLSPTAGRYVIDNLKEGHLTLKITREGEGLGTEYHVIATNVNRDRTSGT
jgi:hypothetical protein